MRVPLKLFLNGSSRSYPVERGFPPEECRWATANPTAHTMNSAGTGFQVSKFSPDPCSNVWEMRLRLSTALQGQCSRPLTASQQQMQQQRQQFREEDTSCSSVPQPREQLSGSHPPLTESTLGNEDTAG